MQTRVGSSRWRALREVLLQTAKDWQRRDAATQAAAIAFFTIFSLSPVLILVTAVAGSVFSEQRVRAELIDQFRELMGPKAAAMIENLSAQPIADKGSLPARIIGGVAFVLGVTAVFTQLQQALNRMWEVPPRHGGGLARLITKRLLCFTLVVGIGFMLLVSLVLSAAISGLQSYLEARLHVPALALDGVNATLSIGIFTVLLAAMFRFLPDARIEWRDVWLGAFFTAVLMTAGKTAIGVYVGRSAVASTYGAASAIVIILFWVYLASLLVLFGAVFTRVWGLRDSERDAARAPSAQTVA